jgi:ABC-type uncharacterized transport system substrate-binding protein
VIPGWRIAARRALLAIAAAVGLGLSAHAAHAQVLAVMSDGSAGYQAVVDELRSDLTGVREGKLRVDSVTADHLGRLDAPARAGYELVVTVGLAAAQAVVARGDTPPAQPVLCLLIPRQAFTRLAATASVERAQRLSAVFIDQPLARQVDLLRLALPERHRVGVVLGPNSQELEGSLAAEAQRGGLELAAATVADRAALYPALQDLIPRSDLLLLLPDPVAINADTVYGLLLTTYRAGVPVVGFSEGLLNAGALLSLFSSAQQQGRQGAEIAQRLLAHEGALPEPQYPRYFSVRINASVARSLGLNLPGEQQLHDALDAHSAAAAPHATDDPARGQP